MTSGPEHDARFLAALADFESCLETPIVPGELPAWLEAAREPCQAVGEELQFEINETHPKIMQQITQQDIELAARVEELRAHDRQLLVQWTHLQTELDRLWTKAELTEPHEGVLTEEAQRLADEGLAFVIAARKQEKALTTWFLEAVSRDRGVGD